MTDIFVAPQGAVSPEAPAASPEQTQSADKAPTTVDASTPQTETPAGTEPNVLDKAKEEAKQPSEADLARKQRNQQRWQDMKQRAADAERRERILMGEIERLQRQAPDPSKITDPDEQLAERVSARLRDGRIEETKTQIEHSRLDRDAAIRESWNAIREDMRSKSPDFDQVVTAETPIHQRAAPFIVQSDKGGEIAYFLGKNPDVARDLFQKFETAPAQALIELGRIEARLSAPQPKQVSTAPKPAQSLGGGASPSGFNIATASVAETAAMLKSKGLIR